MMNQLKSQVIVCPDRNREVEVNYSVSGNWFSPDYEVVACPAMYDGGTDCGRQCISLLSGLGSNLRFLQNRK